MIISLIFILLLLAENLFLPALIGPKTFLISPLFLVGLIIYGEHTKLRFFQVMAFLFAWEIFSGFNLGHFALPFGATVVIYLWLNHFLNISAGLKESNFTAGWIGGTITMSLFILLYSLFFIFLGSSYNISSTFNEFKTLVFNSIFQIIGWSASFVILFRYAIQPK